MLFESNGLLQLIFSGVALIINSSPDRTSRPTENTPVYPSFGSPDTSNSR